MELLSLTTWKWSVRAPYPFEMSITSAPTVYLNHDFILVGGWTGLGTLSRIAAYSPQTDQWTTKGNLLTPRADHGVRIIPNGLLVIGGRMDSHNEQMSEKCIYKDDTNSTMNCTYQAPTEPRCM